MTVQRILDKLESFYGRQEPYWPTDPFRFLLWWYCGYPASDVNCAKGWEGLNKEIGVSISEILSVSSGELADAIRPGGMLPELRAARLKEVAARVKDEFAGDLRAALVGPVARVRKILKSFPSIADPGVDRLLLFGGIAPVAAVSSNCPYVLVRIQHGAEGKNYAATYREAQAAIEAEVSAKFDARTRAYLLLKRHGQELCRPTKPKCPECPIRTICGFWRQSSSLKRLKRAST